MCVSLYEVLVYLHTHIYIYIYIIPGTTYYTIINNNTNYLYLYTCFKHNHIKYLYIR